MSNDCIFEFLDRVRDAGEEVATNELEFVDDCDVVETNLSDKQDDIMAAMRSTWFGRIRSCVLMDGTTVVNDLHDDYCDDDSCDESPNLAAQTGFSAHIVSLGKDAFAFFCAEPEKQLPPHSMQHFDYIDRLKTWVPKSNDGLITCVLKRAAQLKDQGKFDPTIPRCSLVDFLSGK